MLRERIERLEAHATGVYLACRHEVLVTDRQGSSVRKTGRERRRHRD